MISSILVEDRLATACFVFCRNIPMVRMYLAPLSSNCLEISSALYVGFIVVTVNPTPTQPRKANNIQMVNSSEEWTGPIDP